MCNKRGVLLSELIKELQAGLENHGDFEIRSIGTSSGSKSSFTFASIDDGIGESTIQVECYRDKKEKSIELAYDKVKDAIERKNKDISQYGLYNFYPVDEYVSKFMDYKKGMCDYNFDYILKLKYFIYTDKETGKGLKINLCNTAIYRTGYSFEIESVEIVDEEF